MGLTTAKNQILTFTDKDQVGGQHFNHFPVDPAEVALFWSQVWFAAVSDMIAPPMSVPPAASQAAFQSTMAPLVAIPGGGIAAMSAAAVAAFPVLAASIAPMLIAVPPPAPFVVVLAGIMAPFIIAGTTDPISPAIGFATALRTWIGTAQFTPPGPPAPAPFQMAP